MSEFNKDLKPGDLITAYHKGYWRVTHVERRTHTSCTLSRGSGCKVGDEMGSMIHYELVMDSKFRLPSGKRPPKRDKCDAAWCEKVTPEWVDLEAKKAANGWAKLKAAAL